MKLEDIEVGQTVVDKFGNEYVVEIVEIDEDQPNIEYWYLGS